MRLSLIFGFAAIFAAAGCAMPTQTASTTTTTTTTTHRDYQEPETGSRISGADTGDQLTGLNDAGVTNRVSESGAH